MAVTSLLYRPVEDFRLTADVSYWVWAGISTDYLSSWGHDYDFHNIVKLNLGAEYTFEIPFKLIRDFAVRAGYSYDPQPYQSDGRFARNHIYTGFGMAIRNLQVELAAKKSLFARETRRFHTNKFRVGLRYLFQGIWKGSSHNNLRENTRLINWPWESRKQILHIM